MSPRTITLASAITALSTLPAAAGQVAPSAIPGLDFLSQNLSAGDERALLALTALPLAILALLIGSAIMGNRY